MLEFFARVACLASLMEHDSVKEVQNNDLDVAPGYEPVQKPLHKRQTEKVQNKGQECYNSLLTLFEFLQESS
jgi:ABC-type phosphate/phosphonate transport system substrate-binding protein